MAGGGGVGISVKIQSCFLDFNKVAELSPIERQFLLSVLNDFEDESWRIEEFEDFVWDNVAETALSVRERQSAILGDRSRLRAAARNLRLIDGEPEGTKGSEIAEIVLYGIMRTHGTCNSPAGSVQVRLDREYYSNK